MIATLRTLFAGSSARAEEKVRDSFAIELIDQKIRETEAQQRAAKATLASLVQRQRSEERQHKALQNRIEALTEQTREALAAKRDDLASEGADAIAQMENEARLRRETLDRLQHQALRLRNSIEAGHRRIVDLKQGAISARAIRQEQLIQSRLHSSARGRSSADEAEVLIKQVTEGHDPLEEAQILREIDASLERTDTAEKMSAAGFGKSDKTTAADVLARLANT